MSATSNHSIFPSGTVFTPGRETAPAEGTPADRAFLSRAFTELLQIEMRSPAARLFPGPMARLHVALLSTAHNSRLGPRIPWLVAAVLGAIILVCTPFLLSL